MMAWPHWQAHFLFALAWLSFGFAHSLLAREGVKNRLRHLCGAGYRLAYNGFAAVHLGLVWWAGSVLFAGRAPFAYAPWIQVVSWTVYILGWVAFINALRGYDLGRLGGTRQIRSKRRGIQEPENEPLRLDGFHQFVRHPLYAGGLMILWGRIGDPFALAIATWGTVYLLIGTILEERWLLKHYGEPYAAYRRKVPAVFPWKGKVVTTEEQREKG